MKIGKDGFPAVVLGIDPGLANSGWGLVEQDGSKMRCLAYGCVHTDTSEDFASRLYKIYQQICAVIERFGPTSVGIETVYFGQNTTSIFETGQARGAALVACAKYGLDVGEFAPNKIKACITGVGHADKRQVGYMVGKLLRLAEDPHPDHAADALAAAICYLTYHKSGPARA